jgi:hypothetical protein
MRALVRRRSSIPDRRLPVNRRKLDTADSSSARLQRPRNQCSGVEMSRISTPSLTQQKIRDRMQFAWSFKFKKSV